MKSRFIGLSFAAAIVVSLIFGVRAFRETPEKKPVDFDTRSVSEHPVEEDFLEKEIKALLQSEDLSEEDKEHLRDPEGRRWLKNIYREGLASNVPVAFFGKVIDQYDDPVEGALVEFRLLSFNRSFRALGSYEEQVRTYITAETDGDGYFSARGKRGYALRVNRLEKEGFIPQPWYRQEFSYEKQGTRNIHRPEPENPVVYRMWKLEGPEPLIHYTRRFQIPYDGTPRILNLEAGRIASAGDVRIRLLREPLEIEIGQRTYDWIVEVEALNGGLIVVDDEFILHAPDEGYEAKYRIARLADDPDWTSHERVTFFVKMRDGRQYGRVTMGFQSFSRRETTRFTLDAQINPSGSRNLEPGGPRISR